MGNLFGQFLGIPDPVGWRTGFQQGLLDAFLAGPAQHAGTALLGPAQQAIEDALLTAAAPTCPRPWARPRERAAVAGSPAVRAAARGSPRCPPTRGTPGWPRTWPPCGRALSRWRRSHDRGRGTEASGRPRQGRPGGARPLRLGWLDLRTGGSRPDRSAGRLRGPDARALYWHWTFNSGPYAQQVPLIIEAGAATVIAVTAHSPFGETERAAGHWLPSLRLLTATGMCGLAIALLALSATGGSLNEGILVLARNVAGFTGIGLACSLVTGALLAWTLPMGYMLFCQYALLQAGWRRGPGRPGRPPTAAPGSGPAQCSAGLLLFTIRGPRTRLSDDY